MVDRGQFLERMTTLAIDDDIVLEALFHRGEKDPPVVIAPGVPGAGGNMEGAVVTELTWAAARSGHSTLRFNFRGVGASRGPLDLPELLVGDSPSDTMRTVERMGEDLTRAIKRQEENARGTPVAVLGYGLGALVALHASSMTRVDRLVLVAPTLGLTPLETLPRDATTSTHVLLAATQAPDEAHIASVLTGADVTVVPDTDVHFVRRLAWLGGRVAAILDDDRPPWIER